ncbi:type II toxin-antitoxin system PemK/MazF family toxin, partial [Lachnospiraceae bacterium ZAX-1]
MISNNKANRHSTVLTVVPLSSKVEKKTYLPTHVFIHMCEMEGLTQNSIALAEQLTSIE